jgi:hypothetical protein
MAFPTGWNRVCPLVIQHVQVTADQTAMPVLITNASGCLPSEMVTTGDPNSAQSDGGDLRFTTDLAGSNRIACEIVAWTQDATAANAIAEIWVPVDVLTGSDVTIYVWYNAGGGQTQPAAGASFGSQAVWDTHYKAVFHLQTIGARTTGVSPDSTGNVNDVYNGSTSDVVTGAGKFSGGGNGAVFNGSNYLDVPDAGHGTVTGVPTVTGTRTLEGWFKRASNTAAQEFFGWGGNSGNGKRFTVYWQNDGKIYNECRSANSTFNWSADTNWHHVVFTLPSGTTSSDVLGYLDGVSQTMSPDGNTLNTDSSSIVLGGISGSPNSATFFGTLDEVRISNIARSPSWIATQYNNMNAPGSFVVAGTPSGTTPASAGIPLVMHYVRMRSV